jgi:hypothetical protein
MTLHWALRIALGAYSALTAYVGWRTKFNPPSTILLAIGALLLGREIYKSTLSKNPLDDHDSETRGRHLHAEVDL